MQAPIRLHSDEPSAFQVPPPLSLYVHFPWCARKCPYCDFNSHAQADGELEAAQLRSRYLQALREDLESALPAVWGRTVRSVFIGGGTPSLMTGEEVDRLLCDIRALLPLAPDCEITLEANPGTMEAQRFRDFRAAGVNRLSLGIQSFDDDQLTRLGRIHDGRQAVRAAEQAGQHFERFNLDLMWALPGQTVDQVEVEPFEMLPGLLGRPHRLPPIVDAAQPCQLVVVERLDAERQPVHTGPRGSRGSAAPPSCPDWLPA